MHPNSLNAKVVPYESTIPSYMQYLPAVPSKFVCAKLQTFKWNSVLYARAAHVSTRAAYIFHARWVILKRSGLRSLFTRRAGNRDAQSHDPKRSKQIEVIKQNSPRIVVDMDDTRGLGSAVECVCWWRGVNLYFYRLGTATNVFSMEDTDNWWSRSKQEECISQNII